MAISLLLDFEPNIRCECGNCCWTGRAEETDPIADPEQRLTPGSIVPVGECPECGALAYYLDAEAPQGSAQRTLHNANVIIASAHARSKENADA